MRAGGELSYLINDALTHPWWFWHLASLRSWLQLILRLRIAKHAGKMATNEQRSTDTCIGASVLEHDGGDGKSTAAHDERPKAEEAVGAAVDTKLIRRIDLRYSTGIRLAAVACIELSNSKPLSLD